MHTMMQCSKNAAGSAIPERLLYLRREVLQLLAVSNTTFYEWVKRGDIRITKLGRRTYVSASELDRIARDGLGGGKESPTSLTSGD